MLPFESEAAVSWISGQWLVRSNNHPHPYHGGTCHTHPVLVTDQSLSFWGGVDPQSGVVTDISHPLYGTSVAQTILCVPCGRGSCTSSQVLWELIRNGCAPIAIVLRDVDAHMCVGAIVASELWLSNHNHHSVLPDSAVKATTTTSTAPATPWVIPDILHVGDDGFYNILQQCTHPSRDCIPSSSSSSSSSSCPPFSVGQPQCYPMLRGWICSSSGTLVLGTDDTTLQREAVRSAPKIAHHPCHGAGSDGVWTREEEEIEIEEEMKIIEQHFMNHRNRRTMYISEGERRAMRIIIRYARLTTTTTITTQRQRPHYIPITHAHMDGCTYIGPGGLQFVEMLVRAGGRVAVPTTLNAVSTDRRQWQQLGVPQNYARPSIALADAYLQLGCQPSFTCAPYLLPATIESSIGLGTHICWGESNAVVYANSVWGARTEKYADYLDICCAICGLVPATGVHLTENRTPTILLDASEFLQDMKDDLNNNSNNNVDMLFPLLGHVCGTLSDGKVPILLGLESWTDRITTDYLKAFCAAFGTTGSSPLIHIAGITPEARDQATIRYLIDVCKGNRRIITIDLMRSTFETLNDSGKSYNNRSGTSSEERVELVALGNPHLSSSECEQLAHLVRRIGQPKHSNVRIMACISREVQEASHPSHLQILKDWGMEFINDTCWCMLLDPPVIPVDPNAQILTNSGKYAHYGPGLTNRAFRFGSLEDCVNTATSGSFRTAQNTPRWLKYSRRNYTTTNTWSLSHILVKKLFELRR